MREKLIAVVLAAGKGSRFGGSKPKTFLKLYGKPVFWYSVRSFCEVEEVDEIYLVVSKEMAQIALSMKNKYFKNTKKFKKIIIGGRERMDSVYNALREIENSNKNAYIALHDAARPFIKKELIEKIFKKAIETGGASCGIPVVDTIKIIEDNGKIASHLKRDDLTAIQTPQIFNVEDLISAYKKAKEGNLFFTDDTEVFSLVGKDVFIVKGDKDLIKITYKEDLKTAKEILKRNGKKWI